MAIALVTTASGDFTNLITGESFTRDYRIKEILRAAIAQGGLYHKAGVPSTEVPAFAGAFCIDSTNNDLYVCTSYSTPTWTKVTE